MGVEVTFWNSLKTRVNNDSSLNLVVKKIFFGNREAFLENKTEIPCLWLDIRNIIDTRAQIPKRSQFTMIVEVRAKVASKTEDVSIVDALTIDELIKNAIEGTDPTFNGLIVMWELNTESMEKIGDNMRELILACTFKSQPFTSGLR